AAPPRRRPSSLRRRESPRSAERKSPWPSRAPPMPFRRREPLHERLAREAGLGPEPPPHEPGPHWGEVGIHGLHRPRAWDAVVTVDAPEVRGESAVFVILPDSSLLIEDYAFDDDLSPLADAIEDAAGAPLRAEAVRTEATLFSVGARRIRVEEIPEEI